MAADKHVRVEEIEPSRTDSPVSAITELAYAAVACLVLVPSGLLLIALAIASSEPNSDTGDRAGTGSIVALGAVGASLLLSCWPVVYLFARDRAPLATLVTAAGLGAAIVTLYAS